MLKKFFAVFLISVSLLCGCTANRDSSNDTSREGVVFTYKTEYLTETSDKNLINIEIPVFEGENDKNINSLVYRFVVDRVNTMCDGACSILPSDRAIMADAAAGNYNAYCIDLKYRITYNTSQQISIVFEGMSNHKTAAHPLHILFSLNIDPIHAERRLFSEVYPLDGTTYALFARYAEQEIREKADPQWLHSWKGFAETLCDQDTFLAGMTTEADFCHYRTEDSIIVAYPVPHVMGDYMTVQIPLLELYNTVVSNRLLSYMDPLRQNKISSLERMDAV